MKLYKKILPYAGILAVCFEWLAIILFYFSAPHDFFKEKAISYFATRPTNAIIFTVCLSAAALSIWLFITYHVTRFLQTPIKIFTFSMLCYLLLAVVPFHPDNPVMKELHNLFSFGSTVGYIGGMLLLAKNNKNKKLRMYSMYTALPATLLTIMLLFLFEQKYFFLIESSIIFLCQIWIVLLSFHLFHLPSKHIT